MFWFQLNSEFAIVQGSFLHVHVEVQVQVFVQVQAQIRTLISASRITSIGTGTSKVTGIGTGTSAFESETPANNIDTILSAPC